MENFPLIQLFITINNFSNVLRISYDLLSKRRNKFQLRLIYSCKEYSGKFSTVLFIYNKFIECIHNKGSGQIWKGRSDEKQVKEKKKENINSTLNHTHIG